MRSTQGSAKPPARAGVKGWWVLYVLLVVVGVPWYWPKQQQSTLWGVPLWVIVAIICSLLVSLLTLVILFAGSWGQDPQKQPGASE